MEGRIVTQAIVNELDGVFFNADTFFYFVQDINDDWFLLLTEQDEQDILQTEWAYLIQLPLSIFVPKPSPPFPPLN